MAVHFKPSGSCGPRKTATVLQMGNKYAHPCRIGLLASRLYLVLAACS